MLEVRFICPKRPDPGEAFGGTCQAGLNIVSLDQGFSSVTLRMLPTCRVCPVFYRMLSSIPDLYPLDASSSPQLWQSNISPDICIHSPGGNQVHFPQLLCARPHPGHLKGHREAWPSRNAQPGGETRVSQCPGIPGPVPRGAELGVWEEGECQSTVEEYLGGGCLGLDSDCFYVSYTLKMALPVRAVFLGSLTVTGKPRSIRQQFSDSELRLGILLAG